MNIMPKHEGHATVASFDSQYWHCGESEEIAAPQFGQLRVSTVIRITAPVLACGLWAFCPPNSLALRVSPALQKFPVANLLRSCKHFDFSAIWFVTCWTAQTIVCDS
jgi:hypothetical protein